MGETTAGKRKMLYLAPDPAARRRAMDWTEQVATPDGGYANQREWYRPLEPGDTVHKKGGRVGKPLFAGGGGANYGKDYTKEK